MVRRILFVSLACLLSCSGQNTPAPTNTEEVKGTVGAQGGVLSHPTKAALSIPAGALSADVELSIKGEAAPAAEQLGGVAVGQAFLLSPEGQTFALPVRVTIPYAPDQLPAGVLASQLRLRISPKAGNEFSELETTVDEEGHLLSADIAHFSVVVPSAPLPGAAAPLSFSGSGVPAGQPGAAYSHTFSVTGGTSPYTFSLFSGALPSGMTLTPSGVLSGTTSQTGSFTFAVRAADSSVPVGRVEKTFTLAITSGQSACSTLPNTAGLSTESRVATSAPAPVGGIILDGRYHRIRDTIHTGAGGATGATGVQRQETFQVTFNPSGTLSIEGVQTTVGGSTHSYQQTSSFNGTTLQISPTCPSGQSPFTREYSYSSGLLTVYETVSAGTRAITFQRQVASDGGTVGADGGQSTADAGSSTCNPPINQGPQVDEVRTPYEPPTASGGVLRTARFVRVRTHLYTGTGGASGGTGNSKKETIQVTATSPTTGSIDVAELNMVTSAVVNRHFDISTSGTQMTLTQTCPTSGTSVFGFTVDTQALRIYEPVAGGTRVSIFAKLEADGGYPDVADEDAGTPPDAGAVDAGPELQEVASGLTDLVDLDLDGTDVYVLGNSQIRKCPQAGCGSSSTLVTNAFASSIAVSGTTLFAATDYRYISSCSLTATCTLSTFTDVGGDTYPAHLWVANDRLYWISESASARRIQVCPLAGCTTGYPKFVYQGSLLNGLAVAGLVVDATHAYVISYQGGLYRFPLDSIEAADAGMSSSLSSTGFGSGGLDLEPGTLRFTNPVEGKVWGCATPACAALVQIKAGLVNPSTVRSNATHVYGTNRGTSNGQNGYVAGSATVWRYAK